MPAGSRERKIQTWSGLVLIIVVAMLLAIYFLRLSSLKNDLPSGTLTVVSESDKSTVPDDLDKKSGKKIASSSIKNGTFISKDRNFSVKVPAGYSITEFVSGAGNSQIYTLLLGIDSSGENIRISVMPANFLDSLKNSITVVKQSDIALNGLEAVRLDGKNKKDGQNESLVYILSNQKIYTLRGYGQNFNDIVDSFKIIEN